MIGVIRWVVSDEGLIYTCVKFLIVCGLPLQETSLLGWSLKNCNHAGFGHSITLILISNPYPLNFLLEVWIHLKCLFFLRVWVPPHLLRMWNTGYDTSSCKHLALSLISNMNRVSEKKVVLNESGLSSGLPVQLYFLLYCREVVVKAPD